MQVLSVHADAHADVRERARRHLIARRLAQFRPPYRSRVASVAAQHPRLEDLALSFPALLFALAVPYHGRDRDAARALIIAGAPLRQVASAARVPLWLRRLTPAMLREPLPFVPDSPFVARQIVNHLPRDAWKVSGWLSAVARASEIADDTVSVWMARVWAARPPRARRSEENLVALWAWYTQHVPDDPCRVEAAWSPDLSFCNALHYADAWQDNVSLYLRLGGEPVRDAWFEPGVVGAFEIVPLRTCTDIDDEASAMKNCIRGYGGDLAEDFCRLWSLRRDGERVATFEIARAPESPFAHISQVKLISNGQAPEGLWKVVHAWLNAQDRRYLGRAGCGSVSPAMQARAWRRLWRLYWLAKRRIPNWLALVPQAYVTCDL